MSSGAGHALAHRSVASIRAVPPQGQSPSTPHTPPRVISSTYSSPSTIRADDDFVLIEIGSRFARIGFAGTRYQRPPCRAAPSRDAAPETSGHAWSDDYEIWRYDLRGLDLGLFHDKLDRLLRDAFTRYLLIDSRPRRMGLVLDPEVPVPLLSAVLDTLFNNFQAPIISLMSSPTMSAVAAGVRSALVVDMGWQETVVTSVYEYREVRTTRTVRGGRLLLDRLYKLLHQMLKGEEYDGKGPRVLSFEECEDILCRLIWCRASGFKSPQRQSTQLDTVEEQDESEAESNRATGEAEIPLRSTNPPITLQVPFDKLADICDDTFFEASASASTFDDHELPLHLLVHHHLVQLPMDVRAVCMSRIMFTGGCSNILGIKERVMDEISADGHRFLAKGSSSCASNQKLRRTSVQRFSMSSAATSEPDSEDLDGRSEATSAEPSGDIEAKIARNRPVPRQLQGQIRALHTLGPWAGASLMCQLKIPAMATIDRELWLQQGAAGASRPSEVDAKAQQRQSMGAGGLIRGSGGHHTNWTLGVWGAY
ncbi:hypothetical protein ACCO45_003791 [Purpureocillium lilacinum]|uniref:Uncharacterized protein n=1 Tax=Purpureocillium lilacinum TaxID=33203 RepID=A0ACC4E221_PURLI